MGACSCWMRHRSAARIIRRRFRHRPRRRTSKTWSRHRPWQRVAGCGAESLAAASGCRSASNSWNRRLQSDIAGTSLQQAWDVSEFLAAPSAPIVVNGVVFALNSGSATSPAVLYALDGETGKEIWNSGKAIKSFVKSAGLWAISGQVYVATNDAMIWYRVIWHIGWAGNLRNYKT